MSYYADKENISICVNKRVKENEKWILEID